LQFRAIQSEWVARLMVELLEGGLQLPGKLWLMRQNLRLSQPLFSAARLSHLGGGVFEPRVTFFKG
jgi:hypothetical protein